MNVLPLFLAFLPAAAGAAQVRHTLDVKITPSASLIRVSDKVTLATPSRELVFSLHTGMSPSAREGRLEELPAEAASRYGINSAGSAPLSVYKLTLPGPASSFTLDYQGRIFQPPGEQAQEYARSFSETPGIISADGCYLSGASGWYPSFGDGLVTYDLRASVPAPYDTVSGGDRTEHAVKGGVAAARWVASSPQDEINLTCGKYTEYAREERGLKYYAFLLQPDRALADRYLEATGRYISMYSDLLGPYPYRKFALVENFWDTGYGMPSFTLLGSKVIRLPFIINTSYPHEILHNWWGNGVFVDYASGNWCEGLTAYLADYLIAENRGKASEYRMATLQKYADYVSGGADFPLTDFRSRHSSASEAIGYGKALMMYHMLRNMLGDANFRKGLRKFYSDNLFSTASFDHLRAAFESVTGPGRLKPFFDQWTKRAGAPALRLRGARLTRTQEGYDLDFTVAQTQDGPPYSLQVPAAIYLAGQPAPRMKTLSLSGPEDTFHYSVPVMPVRLEIDPEFDVFRRLSPLETPPTLSRVLGAGKPSIIVPAGAGGARWRELAAAWDKDKSNLPEVAEDSSLPAPPEAASYWLFGGENRFAPELQKSLERYGAVFSYGSVTLDDRVFPLAGSTFVFAAFSPASPERSAALILSDSADKLGLLAAKLPHYGKYSWLVFDSGMNSVAAGIWPVRSSPLSADFSAAAPAGGPYPAREPLAELPSVFSEGRLREDAYFLASLPGGRAPGSKGHDKAAARIAEAFGKAGLKPFPADGFAPPARPGERNVSGAVRGTSRPAEYVFITAHYDHLPPAGGAVYPGADDNASGAALLLELARYYAARPRERTIVFAAFDGEETGLAGSKAYLAALPPDIKERTDAALNFDTVGRLGAGKILAIGTGSSDKWVHILRGAGFVTGADNAPAGDLDSSDQASFISAGIPAIQLFSGPNPDYHKPTDTPDKLDVRGMARIAEFSREIIDYLAGDSEFLTRPSGRPAAAGPAGQRKVSTGLVPDFSFSGKGVRAQEIAPGSPLEKAGLRAGDVIVKLGGKAANDLRAYSALLKELSPGQKVSVTYISGDAERTAEIELAAR